MRAPLAFFGVLLIGWPVWSQNHQPTARREPFFQDMNYRCIGPFRGGRSCAVCGVANNPLLYYLGSTGGGVWKSTNGGATWENISDGFFGGSIGAVAVAPSDANVIYVGGGEETLRGNVSHGYGMWKSTDAGKTWKSIGLKDSRHIARVRVHPQNPDIVYAAVIGHLFGPNKERGVFRSKNGGKTWQKILFVNEEVGAVDLILDPNNPRILYASTWRVKRTPYSFSSGGPGCGLYKSVDGGDHWTEISRNKGLPEGTLGIIGVTVSPVDPNRVWAIVEAEDGGVFRSNDAGETWERVNKERKLRQRAWYYSRIYAGPKNVDEVYVLNVRFWRSRDGGKTFQHIPTPHVDHHDLWIAPEDPRRMIIADDGGAQVTFDGGKTWSTYHNQPTAQFYRVTTDNHFPYRVLGAQQDNSTVRILHRSDRSTITERDWEPSAGGESGHLAPKPDDPDIVFGGSYAGYLTRVNHRTKEVRNITIWPDDPLGHGAKDLKYRFNWNFPLFISPHDPKTLYAAGNVLFKSTNEGQSWERISPDLTRNDKSKLGSSGGPITKDNTTVEYYCTIFAALESPHEQGTIWCGSDDGLLHLTRDGGKNWRLVTPPDLPEWSQINSIEAHPTEKGGLYLAATRYKLDDFRPFLYKTTDYGKTWKKITKGIADDHFTRVIRADPKRKGLLYAGTESGIYISFDDGANWQPFQQNLPIVPVTDLAVKNNDLIVATQGRSFWILDDLTPLHQLTPEVRKKEVHLFRPRPTYRLRGGWTKTPSLTEGQNPPPGVLIWFYLKELPDKDQEVIIEILDARGKPVRRFSSKAKEEDSRVDVKKGMNRFVWDMRYPKAESFDGLVFWAGTLQGPKAVPGTYQARLTAGAEQQQVSFQILPDPRSSASPDDFQAQFEFLWQVRNKLNDMTRAIKRIRRLRVQLSALAERLQDNERYSDAVAPCKKLIENLTSIEEALYQTKNESPQDPLNFPVRLMNKLGGLASVVGMGDNRPTDQAIRVKEELVQQIDAELARFDKITSKEIPSFNRLLEKLKVPRVFAEAP
ncbi:MAG: hypothetical protein KatS3mg105_4640 [Gemmatales bacterium]|nr:MAG: hypothetical protein KatS3mg105_4640 [Gemmatales bacterium]